MTAYIKLSTNEYPRHAGDIALDPAGEYAVVQWTDMPEFDRATQRCGEGAPAIEHRRILHKETTHLHIFNRLKLTSIPLSYEA